MCEFDLLVTSVWTDVKNRNQQQYFLMYKSCSYKTNQSNKNKGQTCFLWPSNISLCSSWVDRWGQWGGFQPPQFWKQRPLRGRSPQGCSLHTGFSVSKSCLPLWDTPCTVAHQATLSMRFPRQEYWNGLPFPSPGDLPDPGIKPVCSCLTGSFFPTEPPGSPCGLLNSNKLVMYALMRLSQQPRHGLPGSLSLSCF